MSSIAQSWLSELDLCIAANGGAVVLESSSSSADRSVVILRSSLEDHIDSHGDTDLPSDFTAKIPVDLPSWVPKPSMPRSAQQYRMASSPSATSSRRAVVFQKKAELARAREARLLAEVEEAEYDENQSRTSRSIGGWGG